MKSHPRIPPDVAAAVPTLLSAFPAFVRRACQSATPSSQPGTAVAWSWLPRLEVGFGSLPASVQCRDAGILMP